MSDIVAFSIYDRLNVPVTQLQYSNWFHIQNDT